MAKTTKQARAVKSSPVTDHSRPTTSKRVELAAVAAWEITTLCDELVDQAARTGAAARQPHHSAIIIKLLAARARDLAAVRWVSHGSPLTQPTVFRPHLEPSQ